MPENLLQRIKIIANQEGVTITKIESIIGASKGVISRALANNTDIQSKWISAIAKLFPNYSAEWILTGNGKMKKEDNYLLMEPEINYERKIIQLQEDIINLQKENSQLKDYKSHKHTASRPASGKLEPNK